MKLPNVWVVEGEPGNAGASFSAFDLRVEPAGWTLTDVEEPTVDRLWPWEVIGGLEVVRNVGRTPDGRPATLLELIVNGWPVRLQVPTEDLSNETVAMLGAFAPLGHPLRVSLRVKRGTAQGRPGAGRRQGRSSRRGVPVFLRSPSASGLRSVLVVALVLVATVVAASIAGVATSALPPTGVDHRASGEPDSVPVAPTTSQASSTTHAPSTLPPTSTGPAVAAGGAAGNGAHVVTTTSASHRSSATTKPKVATKASSTTKLTNTVSPSSTIGPSPTTTTALPPATVAPTTTTTGVRRPPTTTTAPVFTPTTRVPRPRPPPTTTTPSDTTTPTTGVTITIP